MKNKKYFIALALALVVPTAVLAHEVYVLDSSEISAAMKAPIPDYLGTIQANLGQFILSGLATLAIIIVVFLLSITRPLERALDPYLDKLKAWAPRIAQATLGLALLAGGYYKAIFGVELPLSAAFGPLAPLMSYVLIAIGIMLVIGVLPRVAGVVTAAIFVALAWEHNVYMLNYGTYLGEALTISLFGGAYTLFSWKGLGTAADRIISSHLHSYKFLIMRVLFGLSLVYASLYAKLFHGALALETVTKYNLTHYFPFDPIFLVLGAMLIEVLIGLCIILGFEIRFATLFFLVFLCLSVAFFGESVWPHIILVGTALSTFCHGYDEYSLSWKLERRKELEPVL